jgi:probable phosphoglycerate mutase
MAEAIGPVVGREPVTDRRLRERHYGVFQGLTLAEMADRHPDALARYMAHNPDYAIPGGESISDRLHLPSPGRFHIRSGSRRARRGSP